MSDEDDPFEEFEEVTEDREGDPFDHLDDQDDAHYDAHDVTPPGHRDELDDGDTAEEADPFPDSDFEVREEPGVRRDEEPAPGDDPFEEPGAEPGDPFGEDGVFEEMDVGELDPDAVWAQLTDAQERGSVAELQERIYAEVSKHRYCEQCEFFSPPPDIRCSHEGTEILEFTDMEQVRVVDCPIVAERKQLEEE